MWQSFVSFRFVSFWLKCDQSFAIVSFVEGERGGEEKQRRVEGGELPHLAGYPEGEGNLVLPYSS
jgi:hypothetical protein